MTTSAAKENTMYGRATFEGSEGYDHRSRVSSSFAGALWRAMRMADPPIGRDDLLLIVAPLPEHDVNQLLMAHRLPTVDEVILLADVFGLSLDELLECQRVANRHALRDRPVTCEAGGLVSMKLKVTPEIRTALRIRKATTGKDINDLLLEILDKELEEELAAVRG